MQVAAFVVNYKVYRSCSPSPSAATDCVCVSVVRAHDRVVRSWRVCLRTALCCMVSAHRGTAAAVCRTDPAAANSYLELVLLPGGVRCVLLFLFGCWLIVAACSRCLVVCMYVGPPASDCADVDRPRGGVAVRGSCRAAVWLAAPACCTRREDTVLSPQRPCLVCVWGSGGGRVFVSMLCPTSKDELYA